MEMMISIKMLQKCRVYHLCHRTEQAEHKLFMMCNSLMEYKIAFFLLTSSTSPDFFFLLSAPHARPIYSCDMQQFVKLFYRNSNLKEQLPQAIYYSLKVLSQHPAKNTAGNPREAQAAPPEIQGSPGMRTCSTAPKPLCGKGFHPLLFPWGHN